MTSEVRYRQLQESFAFKSHLLCPKAILAGKANGD